MLIMQKLACESRDKELDQEFCKFVADKEMPLKELRDKHQAQKLNYERLTHETTTIDLEIKKCTDECSRISEQIVNLEALISECMSQQEILTDKKANAEAQYKSTALDTDKVQQKALVVEARYEDQFNRMEREQQRRRKLENSIDELRGKIRCFAYIGENVPDSCEVDYALKKIHMEDAPGCVFNRIIPQKLACFRKCSNQARMRGIPGNVYQRPTELQYYIHIYSKTGVPQG